jgi:ribosomal protein L35
MALVIWILTTVTFHIASKKAYDDHLFEDRSTKETMREGGHAMVNVLAQKKERGLLVRRKCCTSRLSGTSTTSAECKVVDRKSP